MAQMVKNLLAMWETQLQSLGREDPLKMEMATHSNILDREFHGQRSLASYSPQGQKVSDTTEWLTHTYKHMCACSVVSHVQLCNPWTVAHQGLLHGISQVRILERIAISFSRGTSGSKDQTCASCIGRWVLYHWATRKVPSNMIIIC